MFHLQLGMYAELQIQLSKAGAPKVIGVQETEFRADRVEINNPRD